MNTHADKKQESRLPAGRQQSHAQSVGAPAFQLVDNRPEAIAQRHRQGMADNSPQVKQLRAFQETASNSPQAKQIAQLQAMANDRAAPPVQKEGLEEEELLQGKFEPVQKQGPEEEELLQGKFAPVQRQADPEEEELLQGKFAPIQNKGMEEEALQRKAAPIQKKENDTGLPDNLKTGMENLSGLSLDDVKVHRNSDKPAGLQAHAYAQGTDIHLGPGQEKHLPHEAWHVVQQKQGRVRPTMQMSGGVNVNDDKGLEKEADVMGARAGSMTPQLKSNDLLKNSLTGSVPQLMPVIQRAYYYYDYATQQFKYSPFPAGITPGIRLYQTADGNNIPYEDHLQTWISNEDWERILQDRNAVGGEAGQGDIEQGGGGEGPGAADNAIANNAEAPQEQGIRQAMRQAYDDLREGGSRVGLATGTVTVYLQGLHNMLSGSADNVLAALDSGVGIIVAGASATTAYGVYRTGDLTRSQLAAWFGCELLYLFTGGFLTMAGSEYGAEEDLATGALGWINNMSYATVAAAANAGAELILAGGERTRAAREAREREAGHNR